MIHITNIELQTTFHKNTLFWLHFPVTIFRSKLSSKAAKLFEKPLKILHILQWSKWQRLSC